VQFQTLKSLFTAALVAISAPSFAEEAAPDAAPLLGAYALTPKLQSGGLIVVMRHQRAAISGRWDDFARPWTECSAQRNLSTGGYAGAVETGQAFRILEIPVGEVLSSPMCRTMETARLIFGRAEVRDELGHASEARSRTEETASRDLVEVVAALAPQGYNDILITHGGNIYAAYGQSLTEGDMLFFEQVSGEPVLIGRASAADFDLLANAQLVEQRQSTIDD